MRFLHNLASSTTYLGLPWQNTNLIIPEEVRDNKRKRDVWINSPKTEHCVYSTWEALNPNARLRQEGVDREGEQVEENPPHLCHGIVADYDAVMDKDEVASCFSRLAPLLPTFYGVSLSRKVHFVWLFKQPLLISTFELAAKFLEVVATKLRLKDALPSFDEKAFFNCCQYYTNGCDWYEISEIPLSYDLGLGWLVEATSKIKFRDFAYAIPLPVVKEQLQKNPRFIELWSEIEFELDAQGPSWFVEDSESPKSAIVKESGMFTYSRHAIKNFYSWGDLIGYSFVDQYKATHVGTSVQGIFFDGKYFWREIQRGDWKSFMKDDILHHLRVVRGVKERPNKGERNSELALAYEFIIDHNNIEGAAPFVYKPSGLITVNGRPFLNIHTGHVLSPVDHKVIWGHPDHFPVLSKFFGPPSGVGGDPAAPRFFKGGIKALDTFISWLAYFYRTAHNLQLVSGHNVFVCGPPDVGKSFLSRAVVGTLLNGFREAGDYLTGIDLFGGELFNVALWVVDDGTSSSNAAMHRRWTEMLKRMAANSTFRHHEKFRTPQQVEWAGRVLATLNDDEESIRQVPEMENAVLTKMMLFRTTDKPTIDFPERSEVAAILEKELPYFARFLLDWVTPNDCILYRPNGTIDHRFGGIRPWHDNHLMRSANQTSPSAGFFESLEDWKHEYFRVMNEDKTPVNYVDSWRGSAFQLRKQIASVTGQSELMHRTDNNYVTRMLSNLKLKGYPIDSEDGGDIKYWIIYQYQKPYGKTYNNTHSTSS